MSHWNSENGWENRQDRDKDLLETFSDESVKAVLNSILFQEISRWLNPDGSGYDLKKVVLGFAALEAARKYSLKALKWLEINGTNTVFISMGETLAQDLEMWVARQPSSQFFSLFPTPSFQNLEWKDVKNKSEDNETTVDWKANSKNTTSKDDGEGNQGYDGYDLVASAGRSLFFFQGKLFVLEKPPRSSDYANSDYDSSDHEHIKLRCLWGNSTPIKALLKHVKGATKHKDKLLSVHFIRADNKDTIKNRKRSLASIDMEPDVKQDILTELQDYFDPETEDWCFQNGAPYRKGLMLYGPPGTGKTSLCMAIASEFDLPVYYFHLEGMSDEVLHREFQNLPKRCLVLFEDFDTAGIVRRSTMNIKLEHTSNKPEPDKSDTESDKSESEIGNKDNQRTKNSSKHKKNLEKKNAKKDEEPEPPKPQVTLGGLLNVLDGPGAKEGRLVICTTNSPYSLDEALVRPGRIDRRIFLDRSTKLVAAITFSRIFGTDPRLQGKISKRELNRMAAEFGDCVPNKVFTPCEIQQFCMNWRGKPERAIKEMPKLAKDKLSGAHEFKYDITRNPGVVNESAPEDSGWQDIVMGMGLEAPKSDDSSNESFITAASQPTNKPPLPENAYTVNSETLELNLVGKTLKPSTSKQEFKMPVLTHPQPSGSKLDLTTECSEPSKMSFSEGEEVDSMFQHFYNLSHPAFKDMREPMEDLKEVPDDGKIVMLEVVDPIPKAPVHEEEKEEKNTAFVEQDFSLRNASWAEGLFGL